MRSFRSFLRTKKYPLLHDYTTIVSGPWNTSKVLFFTIASSFALTVFFFLRTLSDSASVTVPVRGGTWREGVLGSPTYINPLLAQTATDKLLVSLTFSGLLEIATDGVPLPLLAETYELVPEKQELRMTLRPGIQFSNGTPVTTADIVFSFARLAPASLRVETPTDETVVLSGLPTDKLLSYATTPIISKNIFESIPAESLRASTHNLAPIGTGPFRVTNVAYENSIPTRVTLARNPHTYSPAPFITKLEIQSYANQAAIISALNNRDIDGTLALDPFLLTERLLEDYTVSPIPTDTILALFIREGVSAETISLLKKISALIDKERLVAIIENGYGTPLGDTTATIETIRSELARLGYTIGSDGYLLKQGSPIRIPIALRKDDRLVTAANALAEALKTIGIVPELKVFDQGTFLDEEAEGAFSIVLDYDNKKTPSATTTIQLYQRSLPYISYRRRTTYEQPFLFHVSDYARTFATRPVITEKVWPLFITH